MPSVTIYTSKDASAIDASGSNWSGSDLHHPVGRSVSDLYTFRSVIYFPITFSGMKTITSAVMWVRGSRDGHAIGDTTSRTMYVRRQGKTWIEDTPASTELWSNRTNDYTTLQGATTTHEATKVFSSGIVNGTWYSIDITAIVNDWLAGAANYGVVLIANNESNPDKAVEFYSREKGSSYRPYVVITYTNNTAPNAPTSPSPTADDIVSTLTPSFTATFSDPDSGDSMSGYQIKVYNDDGVTLIYDTGTIASTSATFTKQYAGSPLAYGTFYQWKARAKDAAGVWGNYTSLQRFQVVDDTPPAAIDGLSASAGDTSITLNWSASELAEVDFDHYAVYRREFGGSDWDYLGGIYDIAVLTYEDLTPEFGVVYEYKVTQFKNVSGGFDIESPDSDIVQVSLVGEARDEWTVLGADGLAEHSFDLPVTDGPIKTPVQQEIFEPLGSSRKTVVRGRTLGAEGTLACLWNFDERDTALEQIAYISENRGPHVLRSPFGDVWLVEFSGADRQDLPGGHLQINIAWTEVA